MKLAVCSLAVRVTRPAPADPLRAEIEHYGMLKSKPWRAAWALIGASAIDPLPTFRIAAQLSSSAAFVHVRFRPVADMPDLRDRVVNIVVAGSYNSARPDFG